MPGEGWQSDLGAEAAAVSCEVEGLAWPVILRVVDGVEESRLKRLKSFTREASNRTYLIL